MTYHPCAICGCSTTARFCHRCIGLRKYGIDHRIYFDLLVRQNYACAICGKSPKAEGRQYWLVVDHDHTKQGRKGIRGLLCHPCNQALGVFGDSVEGIQKVLAYLTAPSPITW